ncbi:hypothetical protein DFJ67_7498 [Asanoa ferruginea]|uniref:Uncharacterized protein n=1 Tax=Asanoa ferruginea TaxID=53367 RepID=A0A3D9ZZ06_9ACTN|nr:hypothetical protein DFJ67_7498 [Asanoa ferruginea]
MARRGEVGPRPARLASMACPSPWPHRKSLSLLDLFDTTTWYGYGPSYG